MNLTIWSSGEDAPEERNVPAPQAWSSLPCATCGRPVGPEAAGSTECLLCTVLSA